MIINDLVIGGYTKDIDNKMLKIYIKHFTNNEKELKYTILVYVYGYEKENTFKFVTTLNSTPDLPFTLTCFAKESTTLELIEKLIESTYLTLCF